MGKSEHLCLCVFNSRVPKRTCGIGAIMLHCGMLLQASTSRLMSERERERERENNACWNATPMGDVWCYRRRGL